MPTMHDTETGTRRISLDSQSAAGGMWGDMARGRGWTGVYVSNDGHGCAEVSIYPIECEDGSFGVEEQTIAGDAETVDGIVRPADSADVGYEWASVLAFDTLEDAQHEADRLGQWDYSYALYLRA
jgi:uncharacterized protein (DUF4213/DUF364 family)